MVTRIEREHLIVNPLAKVRVYKRVIGPWRKEAADEQETRDFRNLREFDEWWRPNFHGEVSRKDGTGFEVNSQFLFTDILLDRIEDAPARGNIRSLTGKVSSGPRKHQQVEVGGSTYNSTWAAFQALGIGGVKECVKFRAELKKAMSLTYTYGGKNYEFKIVE